MSAKPSFVSGARPADVILTGPENGDGDDTTSKGSKANVDTSNICIVSRKAIL